MKSALDVEAVRSPDRNPGRAGRRELTPHRCLWFLACRDGAREHELAAQRGLAQRLAALMGCRFEGELRRQDLHGPIAYVVPNDTIVSLEFAHRCGIRSEADLFGGVVPHPFIATKTITHPLVGLHAAAPEGWSTRFPDLVQDVVLPGLSAFSLDDARAAGRRLLHGGAVRVKLASGTGGASQWVVHDAAQLDARLAALDAGDVSRHGVVVERNLSEPRTFSVGQVRVGALIASYHGTQCTTPNGQGQQVYGGSSLSVVRGGFDALEQHAADSDDLRHAVTMARRYHDAAFECFEGMFASRCNYDVVQGQDEHGRPLAGVLEQSWRIGGASGAEVAALQRLHDEPARHVVRASTVEAYGDDVEVPKEATLYYRGTDAHVGRITKYVEVHADAHT
jgi:hypothetical protein